MLNLTLEVPLLLDCTVNMLKQAVLCTLWSVHPTAGGWTVSTKPHHITCMQEESLCIPCSYLYGPLANAVDRSTFLMESVLW